MAAETIYALEEANVSISGGGQLSGITQGDGSHLNGLVITLDTNDWVGVNIQDTEADFQDSDSSQTLDGAQTFNGTSFGDGRRVEAEYSITVEDPDGVVYTLIGFNINEPGVTSYSTVEGLAFVDTGLGFPPVGVPLTVTGTSEGPSFPYADLAVPDCFTPGTIIRTVAGDCDVADLRVGDRIPTSDHGLQTIRWIGHRRLPAAVLAAHPRFRPVVIQKDALGEGVPAKTMSVSPQHRILITGWRAELMFGATEILVPAIKLCNDSTICQVDDGKDVTYIHVLFDAHEVIWADGVQTESYLPTPDGQSITDREVNDLFPELSERGTSVLAARPCISDRRTIVLTPYAD
ncbi:MAG: Hint domain-containing protein [Yoonia sp.]|uniref:Hint domain-containing protein n=1 Tax=Yoonia sp. TaxID=2212373 RepID=UPI003265437E